MRVDHSRSDIFVTEELLDGADVVAVFKQVWREAVPKGMATARLGNFRFPDGELNRVLEILFRNMMPTRLVRARINRHLGRRKNVLPNPGAFGIGILAS